MARVSTFAHDGLYLERGRLALTSPLRTSAVVASLFAVGLAVDQVQLLVVLCIGALFTGLADNGEAYPRRARSMAATALWCTVAATLGAAVADVQLIHLAAGFVVAAMCGYVGVLGPRSAVNGLLSLVLFVIYAGNATTEIEVVTVMVGTLSGGVLTLVVALVAWPTHRFGGTRAAIATGYRMLAVGAIGGRSAAASPAVAAAFTSAGVAVADSRGAGATEQWMDDLVNRGQQARLHLLALVFEPAGVDDGDPEVDATREFAVAFAILSRQVARALVWPVRRRGLASAVATLEAAVPDLVAANGRAGVLARAAADELIATANDVQAPWPVGRRAVVRHQSPAGAGAGAGARAGAASPGWRTVLRSHLVPGEVFFGHGVRLAIAITIATAITFFIDQPHDYWLPMTVAWMAKPDLGGTVGRVSLRVGGTLAGVALCAAVFAMGDPGSGILVALVAVGSLLALAFMAVNYAVAVGGVTIIVLTLFASLGQSMTDNIGLRVVATLAAAGLTVAISMVRPHRGGGSVSRALADTVEAMAAYMATLDAVSHGDAPASDLDMARRQVLVERTRAEAAVAAAEHEPGRYRLHPTQARLLLDELVAAAAFLLAGELLTTDLPVDGSAVGVTDRPVATHGPVSLVDLSRRLAALDEGGEFRRQCTPDDSWLHGHIASAHHLLDELDGGVPVR